MAREGHNHVFTSGDKEAAAKLAKEIADSTGRKTTGTDGSGNSSTAKPSN